MSKKFIIVAALGLALIAVVGGATHSTQNNAKAAQPADFGLKNGYLITAMQQAGDPDVFVIKEVYPTATKRVFKNPTIGRMYPQFGANGIFTAGAIKQVSAATRDAFVLGCYVRNAEMNDPKVYYVESTGADTATIHWVNMDAATVNAADPLFFPKTFDINNAEFTYYQQGTAYTSISQIPACTTGEVGATPTPVAGSVNVSLASDSPVARTVTTNAQGVEFLKFNVSGTGTLSQMVFKRSGPGATGDLSNVYLYEGARRLTTGKTITSSTGEVTFSALNWTVSGTRTFTLVGDLAGTAGNVDYFTLTGVTLAAGTVGGVPISGNNVTISGATSGTITMSKVGSLGSPNAGQAGAEISEFKLSANTEAASIKRIQMIQGGTMSTSNFANLVLKTADGTHSWNGTIDSAGYIVFDLGSGFTIAKGANTTFKVYSDVNGKKADTVLLYFEYSSDVLGIGDQYGFGMAATITDMDTSGEAHQLTLQGGVLTISNATLSASDVGTATDDTVFARLTYAAASNIEIRKTRIDLSLDLAGDGTWDDISATAASYSSGFTDLDDVKMVNEDTNQVLVGPSDGSAFTDSDSTGNPSGTGAAQHVFTDTINLNAGQTLHAKITADLKTANTRTGTDIQTGSKVAIGIDDYSDNTGVTELKYAGTNTALAAADIVPNANINGPAMTVRAATLTLSLASTPSDQTVVKGRSNVDVVGIVFAATNASPIKVTAITVTGYYDDDGSGAFTKGGANLGQMVSDVSLVEKETGTVVSSGASVTNNLSASTGTVAFSNMNWNIPAGGSKTLLVRVNLLNLTVPVSNNHLAFDIVATTDVTGVDNNSSTVNGTATPNGCTSCTIDTTVTNNGSMTLAAINDTSVRKSAVYWGQTGAPASKFRLTATNEGQFLERFTIAASNSTEATNAKNNVKTVYVTYKNKAGDTLTSSGAMGNAASVNFGWSGDARPYVPKDSNMDISVSMDMKSKADGGTTQTQTTAGSIFFSLDLVDKFNGSFTDGFRAVGDGSNTVLDGTSSGINDVPGANDQYVYRVFPKFDQVALSSPYSLVGTPDVLKFSITAMGLTDSKLLFNGNNATASGSIVFAIVASGENNTNSSSSFTIYDADNTALDTATATNDERPSPHGSVTFDFTNADVEITGGTTKTFRIQFTNPNQHYAFTSSTGRAADYFQMELLDENNNVYWVGNDTGSSNDLESSSVVGTLRNLPIYGPTFQR